MHNDYLKNEQRKLFRSRRSKIRFIALVFGAIGVFFIGYVSVSIIQNKPVTTNNIDVYNFNKNSFSKFFHKIGNTSGKEISILADKVTETEKDHFKFEKVTSSFTLPNNENGSIIADYGNVVRGDEAVYEFSDNVVMSTGSGLFLKTQKAFFNSSTKMIFAKSKIDISKDDTRLSADEYCFNTEKNELILEKNATAHNQKQDVKSDKITILFDRNYPDSVKNFTAEKSASLRANGYELYADGDVSYDTKKVRASKNVKLIYQKDQKNAIIVKSDKMEANITESFEIKDIIADGNVNIITKVSTVKASHGVFRDNKVFVSGNVVISKEEGNAFGEEAELDLVTEKVSMKKSSGIVFRDQGQD